MRVDNSERSMPELEPDSDCAFVTHHTLEACCDVIMTHFRNQRNQSDMRKNYQVGCLQRHRTYHLKVFAKTGSNAMIECFLAGREHRPSYGLETFLRAHTEDVVVHHLGQQQVIKISHCWRTALHVPGGCKDPHF